MPQTIQFLEGDGNTDDLFNIALSLPDVGSTIQVDGTVMLAGSTLYVIATTTLTAPAAPAAGTGTMFYNIQVDGATGIATIQSNLGSVPALNNATSRIVFSQSLVAGNTDLALAGNDVTPDPNLGSN